MSLAEIIEHLRSVKSRPSFDAWVSANLEAITDFFYTLSRDDLQRIRFDTDFYFGEWTQSAVFKEFEQAKQHSEPFDAFLFLLASVAEKLAVYFELTGTIDHLMAYLPESSVKFRLEALSLCQNVDNTRTGYLDLFPTLMELLQKAELCEEQYHTQPVVDFLVYYYDKAEGKLSEKRFESELEDLKKCFASKENINKFRFLGHFTVQERVAGRYPHELALDESELSVLYPSAIMESHFKYNINLPVISHVASRMDSMIFMGYEKSTILNDILERGRTVFDKGYDKLEPRDKVLLYCYFNMKKHFFTSVVVYRRLWPSLLKILSDGAYEPVFIDLGCGPLTSGLAFAELFYDQMKRPLKLNYIGIDISNSMIEKAREFTECDLFDRESTFQFYSNWDAIGQEVLDKVAGKNNPFFVNASYLFANLSEKEVKSLAAFVKRLSVRYKNVHFIFQNPDRADRNETWERFKTKVEYDLINKERSVERVVYKTSRGGKWEPSHEDVYYEILTIRA